MAQPEIDVRRRDDGAVVLRSRTPLGPFARCLGDLLESWARAAPDRDFLVERDAGGAWRRATYAQARHTVRSLARALVDLGASRERPLLLLSDNGIDHALLQLGAMHVGIPAAPVSPAYSIVAKDKSKLERIAGELAPPSCTRATARCTETRSPP